MDQDQDHAQDPYDHDSLIHDYHDNGSCPSGIGFMGFEKYSLRTSIRSFS